MARSWSRVWQELGKDHKALEVPLRFLDAAVRYRETEDPRILLRLPVEERKLLEPLLGDFRKRGSLLIPPPLAGGG